METNQLLINYYKKEEIKKVKQRQMEGLSNNEIINLANKTYITEEEIKQLLGIENEEKNINYESDFVIEDEEIERITDTELKNLAINCYSCLKYNHTLNHPDFH